MKSEVKEPLHIKREDFKEIHNAFCYGEKTFFGALFCEEEPSSKEWGVPNYGAYHLLYIIIEKGAK